MSRRVLVLAVITGALAAASLIDPTPTTAPPIAFSLPALAQMDVIELSRRNQPTIRLERRGADWFIGDAPLDRHVQQTLRDAFAQPIPMDARVKDADPDRYSLGEGNLTAKLGAVTIRIGKVVDGRQTFVRTEDGAIYRARANLRRLFDRPAHTWPERRIISGTAVDVSALTLKQGRHTRWGVTRTASGWSIATDPGGDADPDQAEGIAHMLATLRVERFVKPVDFTPRLTVDLVLRGAPHTLEISALDGRTALARVVGRPGVFRIEKAIVELLDLPVSALQDRRLYRGDPAQVTGLELRGTPLEAAGPKGRADLLALRALSLPRSAPPAAFASPEPVLVVLSGETRWTLELGAPFGQGARYARSSDGRVFVLGPATLRELTPPVLDGP